MIARQRSIRRAAAAVFLLFAAVLGVTRAEASIPRVGDAERLPALGGALQAPAEAPRPTFPLGATLPPPSLGPSLLPSAAVPELALFPVFTPEAAPGAGWKSLYVTEDELGNVTHLTDQSGAVIERYQYEGYGKFRIFDAANSPRTVSSFGWNRLFQGREYLGFVDAYDFRARVLWPELGRFGQEDPAGTVDSLNRYQALEANWGTYSDPHGLYVGEDGRIISLETAAQNIRTVAKDCKGTDSGCLIRRLYFGHLAAAPAMQAMNAPLNQDRYLFTDEAGWLDLRHVYQLAHLALNKWMFGVDAEYAGEVIEEDQAERGHHSAFSYEDLPSNHQGIKIANLLKYSRSPADDLINYLRTLRPVDRSQAEADDLRSILNFSVEPVLSSREAGLRATKNFVYKPSGSQTKDQKWILKLDIGFGTNPGWKERNPPTTPIGTLARRMVWERWAPQLDFEPGRRAH